MACSLVDHGHACPVTGNTGPWTGAVVPVIARSRRSRAPAVVVVMVVMAVMMMMTPRRDDLLVVVIFGSRWLEAHLGV